MKKYIKVLTIVVFSFTHNVEGATATSTVTLTATVPATGTLNVGSSSINFGTYSGSSLYQATPLVVTTDNSAATLSASSTSGNLTSSGSSTPIAYTLTNSTSVGSSGCTSSTNTGSAWSTINPAASGTYYACFSLAAVSNPNSGVYTTATPITFTLTY